MVVTASYLDKMRNDLVFDPKLKKPITERTGRLRDELVATVPKICSERARLLTLSMRETEGEPTIIRRARGLEKVLSEMTIFIREGELIVGNQASEVRATPVFPEFAIRFLVEELDGNPMRPEDRPGDKFLIDEEDERVIREIAPWWKGKTVQEYKIHLLPDEVRQAYLEQRVFLINQGDSGGNGHFILDYPKILNKGLACVIKEAEEELNNLKPWQPEDFEKGYFLEAVIITLRAAINFARRFSKLAMEMAEGEADPARKAELREIAQHCAWVPENPARSFWEAMQSLWFAHLLIQIESNGHSMSFGRFDQYMYPFYADDIAQGKVTPEKAVELIECLWIKSLEINKIRAWYHTRYVAGYPLFQNLTLGGQTTDGKPAINDVSWLALEATADLKLPSPSVTVRCWNGMPEDFLLKALETVNIHRGGQPALYNDEAVIPSQLKIGVALEDAYDYAVDGCVEPSEPGKSLRPGNYYSQFNLLKVLELALNNGRDPRSGITLHPNINNKDLSGFESPEEVMAVLKDQIEYYTRLLVIGINCVAKAFAELAPTPFASALVDDCIKKGKDIEWGGARYNSAGMIQMGMANVGNSLAALKRLMFEEGRLTPQQIKHALETNFEDEGTSPTGEEIRQLLLAAPKYGNDDEYADYLVKEAYEFTAKNITNYVVYTTGGSCNTQTSPVTSHIALGGFCGATPDGRKAWMPVNEGVSPAQGTDTRGPTATLKSVSRLDHIICADGTLLNQKFNPVSFQGLGQLQRLASLVRAYFALKGMHIQFNIVSVETLKDAQRHPEKYPNLLVRVAGYSALFTTLEPAIQNDIISRTEQSWS